MLLWQSGLLEPHGERDCECPYCVDATAVKGAKKITAEFTRDGWVFNTDIPHAKFTIMEDDDTYGKGIVFEFTPVKNPS